jgi:predicted transcriptional regulator
MNAIAAGPGFPRAPPSVNMFNFFWMLISPISWHLLCLLCGFLCFCFVVAMAQSHQFIKMKIQIYKSIGSSCDFLTLQTQVQLRFAIESKFAELKQKNSWKFNNGVKRGRMEIIADILLFCDREKAKTSIMYKTNLNYAQLQIHLKRLVTIGMLLYNEQTYTTTEKGYRFLELFAELQGILKENT